MTISTGTRKFHKTVADFTTEQGKHMAKKLGTLIYLGIIFHYYVYCSQVSQTDQSNLTLSAFYRVWVAQLHKLTYTHLQQWL